MQETVDIDDEKALQGHLSQLSFHYCVSPLACRWQPQALRASLRAPLGCVGGEEKPALRRLALLLIAECRRTTCITE